MGNVPKPHIAVRFDAATHGTQTPVRIVLHDTECGDAKGIGDLTGVASYWQNQGLGYGSHFIVDAEGLIAQGAPSSEVCWHVANHNTGSIGIEQIGFARFSLRVWLFRRSQRIAVARLLAYLSDRWDIPLEHSIDHGVCLHRDFKDGTHTDPGPNYPLRRVLKRARKIKEKYVGQ